MKFRFNATDQEGNMKITDPINPGQYYDNDDTFQVEKSDINVTYIYGNETTVTLTVPTEFGIQIYDLDNASRTFLAQERAIQAAAVVAHHDSVGRGLGFGTDLCPESQSLSGFE